jgi:hypothetical protein
MLCFNAALYADQLCISTILLVHVYESLTCYAALYASSVVDLLQMAQLQLQETREKLYRLYRDHLVSLQEVPRQPNHSFSNTIYLWTVQVRVYAHTA